MALTAAHLINLLPTPVLDWTTPYQVLFGHLPTCSHLRIFGYLYFPHLQPYVAHKLESRSKPCVFLGYTSHHKGYRSIDLSIGHIYVSRLVTFNKFPFPYNVS